MEASNAMTVFENRPIRNVEHKGELWFSVVDIVEILTDSTDASNYWTMLKKREPQLSTICGRLKLKAADGRKRLTDCANTEGVLRLIQSVPSQKAEPFKLWLANLGKQNLEEMNDPELGFDRLYDLYKAKGYSDEWINNRVESIRTRKRLTDEWQKRGVKEGQEYAILTSEIATGTFGLAPQQHARHKGLEKENLRDHMTPLELIFTALGEEATRIYAQKDDAQGFNDNLDAAQKGGKTTGDARRLFEKQTGESVVSADNYLKQLKADESE